jgi:hypothetical protein
MPSASLRPRGTAAQRRPFLLGRHTSGNRTQGGGNARKTRTALPWATVCNAFGVMDDSSPSPHPGSFSLFGDDDADESVFFWLAQQCLATDPTLLGKPAVASDLTTLADDSKSDLGRVGHSCYDPRANTPRQARKLANLHTAESTSSGTRSQGRKLKHDTSRMDTLRSADCIVAPFAH